MFFWDYAKLGHVSQTFGTPWVLAGSVSGLRAAFAKTRLARSSLLASAQPPLGRNWVKPPILSCVLLNVPCSPSNMYTAPPVEIHFFLIYVFSLIMGE